MDPLERRQIVRQRIRQAFPTERERAEDEKKEQNRQKDRRERLFEDINRRLNELINYEENWRNIGWPDYAVDFSGSNPAQANSFDAVSLMPEEGENIIVLMQTANYYLYMKNYNENLIQKWLGIIEKNKKTGGEWNEEWLYKNMNYATLTDIDPRTGEIDPRTRERVVDTVVFYELNERAIRKFEKKMAARKKEQKKKQKNLEERRRFQLDSIPSPDDRESMKRYVITVFNNMKRGDFRKFKKYMRTLGRDDLVRIIEQMIKTVDEDTSVVEAAEYAINNVVGFEIDPFASTKLRF